MNTTVWALWRNKLTYFGSFVALIALIFILSLLFFETLSSESNPYIGVFTFLVLPGVLVLGLGLAASGIVLARLRIRPRMQPGDRTQVVPRIDFTAAKERRNLLWIALGLISILPFIGVMSYEGYHYTESKGFCGVCHVMDPEYLTHSLSPHASVACATCHVGHGFGSYVQSKLSGIRRVVAVALDNYPRPIPAALGALPSAMDACQQCHWPNRYIGDKLLQFHHFASDEASTPRPLQVLVKVGGNDPSTGPVYGIHAHMALDNTVEYVADDERLQTIAWTRVTDHATGKSVVYRSDGLKGDDPPSGVRRTVGCMDCHSRPAHILRSPDRAANEALLVDDSLRTLPFAKRQMVAALVAPYASREEGEAGVAEALRSYYRSNHAEVLKTHAGELERLVQATQEIYWLGFFPQMQADWRAYPSNIGHKESAGCFRCHDGRHVDAQGRAVSQDCASCHEFLVPTEPGKPSSPIQVGAFEHPLALEGPHAELHCNQCHDGGVAPSPTCAGCHADVTAFRAGSTPLFASFGISADSMNDGIACEDCHDLSTPMTVDALQTACVDCHGELPQFVDIVRKWREESAQLSKRAAAHADPGQAAALEALHAAGPLHNMEATRKILEALAGPQKP